MALLGFREPVLLESCQSVVPRNITTLGTTMSVIGRFFSSIEQYFHRAEVRRVEAYLAQAQNLPDLERRMRALEKSSGFFLP